MARTTQLMWLADRPTASSPCPHQGRFGNEPPGSLM